MGGFFSVYLYSIIWAWLVANLVKYLLKSLRQNNFKLSRRIFDSGDMPSAHTATVASITTVIGLIDGFGSSIFGLSVIFLAIVMHDAVRVRRSTGEQGIAINKLIESQKVEIKLPYFSKGHTPIEVAMGLVLGVAIGVIVFLATK